jgi:ribosome assembly protein 1
VYAVLSKRRAKILNEEMHEGSSIIVVMAQLPAAESFGFAEELFRKTSGAASAQLEFSHWDVLDVDPNFVPTTEEELEEFGDNVGGIAPNLARKYVDNVRRRKVR